ncbi:helix-turn-helix domain-containing protein [Ascidiimonas aurantiaca]|uniref:helix-turn-helix domain-containing protein n=1 Tax=Ascidiimonas aurantiaca TaxID=1685432 RepID=UPI0030EF7A82
MRTFYTIHIGIFTVIFLGVVHSTLAWSNPYFNTSDKDSLMYAASYHFSVKNYEKAIYYYEKALGDNYSDSMTFYLRIAMSHAGLGNGEKTVLALQNYLNLKYDPHVMDHHAFDNIRETKAFKTFYKRYIPKINGWIVFYFYSGLIGIFIALIINLKKNKDYLANLLISIFILLHSLFIINVSLYLSNYTYYIPHTLYLTATFSFLYGPLLFFYFKRVTQQYHFKLIDLLHLLPSIVLSIYILPIYLLSSEEKLHMMINRDTLMFPFMVTVVILKILSLSIYGFLVYRIYVKAKHKKHEAPVKKWQRNIVIFNVSYIFAYLIYGLILMKIIKIDFLIHPQIILMSMLVLYVGFSAYARPEVFNMPMPAHEDPKYRKSGLTERFSIELKEQLVHLFEAEKIFKDSSISLDSVSERLGTTRHNTSQVINEHFNMNFFELVNTFRIEEAIEMLKNDSHRNLHIIDVAYEVGFNNKVTFNKAFKKETQLTPTQFLKTFEKQVHVNYR